MGGILSKQRDSYKNKCMYSLSQRFGHSKKISFIKLQHKIKQKHNIFLFDSVKLFINPIKTNKSVLCHNFDKKIIKVCNSILSQKFKHNGKKSPFA